MKIIGATFLRGLVVMLPIVLTVYVFYLLATTSENLMGEFLRLVVPASWYWPGFGLLVSLLFIFAVGFVVSLPGLKLLVVFTDWLFSSVPLVRSVYSTLKDFADFLSAAERSEEDGKPVLVEVGAGVQLVGMITSSDTSPLGEHDDHVLVYLPMSYQIGGYTVLISKDKLQPVDMSLEDAMSYVVTAGVRKSVNKNSS